MEKLVYISIIWLKELNSKASCTEWMSTWITGNWTEVTRIRFQTFYERRFIFLTKYMKCKLKRYECLYIILYFFLIYSWCLEILYRVSLIFVAPAFPTSSHSPSISFNNLLACFLLSLFCFYSTVKGKYLLFLYI